MNLKKYWFIWGKTTTLSLETIFTSKGSSLMYLAGKLVRFFFFFWLLLKLSSTIELISGFSSKQLVIFYLIFNLFDMFGQIFFRGVYWFRGDVVSGKLDLSLVKPASVLFQVLTSRTDFLDFPLFLLVVVFLVKESIGLPLDNWAFFLILAGVSLTLITAVHILAAAIGVLTTEIDHTMMVYRDLSAMARLPVDIYTPILRAILTFVVPVGIIMTFPAKALLGLLSWPLLSVSAAIALLAFYLSRKLWHYALTQYSSASS